LKKNNATRYDVTLIYAAYAFELNIIVVPFSAAWRLLESEIFTNK
jgi:hypothetical protein